MKRKMFAALALSATLAMGAVPAFAADSDGTSVEGSGDFKDNSNKATTVVSIKTDASQISATIPVKATIVAKANGGDITAPTADAYKVTNNSSFDVYITSVKATEKAGWKLADSVDVTNNPTGTVADIALSVGPKGASATETDKPTVLKKDTAVAVTGDAMKMSAKADSGTDNELGLVMKGQSTKVKTVADTAVEAIGVEYTISAQPVPDPAA